MELLKKERLVLIRFRMRENTAKILVGQLEKNADIFKLKTSGWKKLKTEEKVNFVLKDQKLNQDEKLKKIAEITGKSIKIP